MNTKLSIIDFLAIALMLAFLFTANHLDWFVKYSGFAMIPLLAFYYLGKYAQKKEHVKKET